MCPKMDRSTQKLFEDNCVELGGKIMARFSKVKWLLCVTLFSNIFLQSLSQHGCLLEFVLKIIIIFIRMNHFLRQSHIALQFEIWPNDDNFKSQCPRPGRDDPSLADRNMTK